MVMANISNRPPDQVFLNEKQVAEITGRGLQSLRNDRHLAKGFPYIKFGRLVRYKMSDVFAAMEACRIVPGGGYDAR
jgi:hypothetical protein